MRSSKVIGRSEALIEARRCLGCYDAPCVQACPAQVDIPSFIKRLSENNLEGAGALVYQANPLSSTCGIACPTSVLCEGACTLSKMGQLPIRIGSLHAFSARHYVSSEKSVNKINSPSIAVIGGGPSGLGCAIELLRYGDTVHLYEKSDGLGGLVNRVIPFYRLPKDVVDKDLERINDSGIVFHFNETIKENNFRKIFDSHNAVFIGIGLNKVVSSTIFDVDLPGVFQALDFLDDTRKNSSGFAPLPQIGKRVVIIGGGNVALDAAVMAKKLGSETVIVIYRRSKVEMPGWESEYLEACALGVEFRWLSTINKILSNGNQGLITEIQGMHFTSKGTDGRLMVEPLPGTNYQIGCDSVIMALGQTLDQTLVKSFDLATNSKGTIKINLRNYQTSQPKIFAAGEAVSGGATIVESMSQGMKAGRAIHEWLLQSKGSAI